MHSEPGLDTPLGQADWLRRPRRPTACWSACSCTGGARAKQGVQTHHPSLQACYARPDCQQRIACITPIIGRIHEGEGKRDHR
jgi:hypothetical protein